MRICSIYRHYWPDTTPYARLLRTILEDRARAGDQVDVLTGQPSYNDNDLPSQPHSETLGGVNIRRFRLLPARKRDRVLRAGSLAWFLGRATWSVVASQRPDLILVNCNPPIGMGVVVRTLHRWRGVPYIYHCEDIHPEALLLAGQVHRGWFYRLLRAVDAKNCQSAAAVVVLSNDMLRTMRERGVPDDRLVVINNFPLDTYNESRQHTDLLADLPSNAFIVLFAGNIGNFQGLELLIEAAKRLGERTDIHFVFMGSGLARDSLERDAGHLCGRTVHFVGQHSVEVARAVMARSGIGVVALKPGVTRVAYPSKLMTYVASGCPVLALVEPDSAVATDVHDDDLGYVCGDRRPEAIAAAIEKAYGERARWDEKGREALQERAAARFGRAVALAKWSSLLDRLVASGQIELSR